MLDSLVAWLRSEDRIDPSGHCLSWSNPGHPGYPYPEISALLLTFLATGPDGTDAKDGADDAARRRGLAAALVNHPHAEVGVGRDGVSYTFDTAMATRALVRGADDPQLLDTAVTWARALTTWVMDGRACSQQPPLAADTRWSLSFGAHQSKVSGALLDLRSRSDELADVPVDAIDAALDHLVDGTLALQEPDGRFRIHARSPETYLHSHCYAVEGLLAHDDARQRWPGELRAAADFLARAQRPDGGLPAWHDGFRGYGPLRADSTAQAVRILTLVDPSKYEEATTAGRQFLGRLRAPDGGLRYEPGSADLAVWPAIFAAQALPPPGTAGALEHGRQLV